MRTCIQQDPYNRFYQDFYQVVSHGDRQDDWVPLIVTLKKHISQYPKYSDCYKDVKGKPGWRNSSAFEGNFLEAINLTMNSELLHLCYCFFEDGVLIQDFP